MARTATARALPAARATGAVGAAEPVESVEDAEADIEAVNQVHLVGRVAAPATSRTLPSGDTVTILRLVVGRPPPTRKTPHRAPATDTVDCALWTARLRQRASSLAPGTIVEVEGALRRRFWRSGAVAVSRYEIEVATLRRL
jgi:single-strand DNA-binding protein